MFDFKKQISDSLLFFPSSLSLSLSLSLPSLSPNRVTHETLSVSKVLSSFKKETPSFTYNYGIPNPHFPSDHISLGVDVDFVSTSAPVPSTTLPLPAAGSSSSSSSSSSSGSSSFN